MKSEDTYLIRWGQNPEGTEKELMSEWRSLYVSLIAKMETFIESKDKDLGNLIIEYANDLLEIKRFCLEAEINLQDISEQMSNFQHDDIVNWINKPDYNHPPIDDVFVYGQDNIKKKPVRHRRASLIKWGKWLTEFEDLSKLSKTGKRISYENKFIMIAKNHNTEPKTVKNLIENTKLMEEVKDYHIRNELW